MQLPVKQIPSTLTRLRGYKRSLRERCVWQWQWKKLEDRMVQGPISRTWTVHAMQFRKTILSPYHTGNYEKTLKLPFSMKVCRYLCVHNVLTWSLHFSVFREGSQEEKNIQGVHFGKTYKTEKKVLVVSVSWIYVFLKLKCNMHTKNTTRKQ